MQLNQPPLPVPVPHRNSLPTTQFTRVYSVQAEHYETDNYEKAYAASFDELQSYAGHSDTQVTILAEIADDARFSDEVEQAANRIANIAQITSLYESGGALVKDETQQLTQAYKIRGAANFILQHAEAIIAAGVVTASAGNHGQGVALAASKLGVTATVVVPRNTPQVKIDGIALHGGRVVVTGDNYDQASAHAQQLCVEQAGVYVPAYDHRVIMAGQATIGLELLQQAPDLTDVVVAVGGGGLLAGLAKYLRVQRPEVRVWGSGLDGQSAAAAAFLRDPKQHTSSNAFADGIAVKQLGRVTGPEIRRCAAGVLTVSEMAVRAVVAQQYRLGHTLEGAGAVGLAATRQHRDRFGALPVAVATGGNIDHTELERCLATSS